MKKLKSLKFSINKIKFPLGITKNVNWKGFLELENEFILGKWDFFYFIYKYILYIVYSFFSIFPNNQKFITYFMRKQKRIENGSRT
jgi:hypothetical protein